MRMDECLPDIGIRGPPVRLLRESPFCESTVVGSRAVACSPLARSHVPSWPRAAGLLSGGRRPRSDILEDSSRSRPRRLSAPRHVGVENERVRCQPKARHWPDYARTASPVRPGARRGRPQSRSRTGTRARARRGRCRRRGRRSTAAASPAPHRGWPLPESSGRPRRPRPASVPRRSSARRAGGDRTNRSKPRAGVRCGGTGLVSAIERAT